MIARRLGRIGRKIFKYILFVSFLILLTVSSFEVINGYIQSKEYALGLYKQLTIHLSKSLKNLMSPIENSLKISSASKGILEEGITDRFRFYLQKLLKHNPAISRVSVYDINGNFRMSISRFEPSDTPDFTKPNPIFFQRAKEGLITYGPIHYRFESKPYIYISQPLSLFSGNVIGLMLAEISLSDIQDWISKTTIGKSGYVYLVDSQGNLIAHPDILFVLSKPNLKHYEHIKMALTESNEDVFSTIYKNPKGISVLSTAQKLKDIDWVFVVAQPTREVFSHIYHSFIIFGIGAIIIFLLAFFMSIRFSSTLAEPILSLKQTAEKIGNGMFENLEEIKTKDEIELLSKSINEMAMKLKNMYGNIEEQVYEKTKELTALFSFTSAISQSLNTKEILKIAGEEIIVSFGFESFIACTFDEKRNIKNLESFHVSEKIVNNLIEFIKEEGFLDLIVYEKRSIYASFLTSFGKNLPPDFKNVLILPITYRGDVLGVFIFFSSEDINLSFNNISLIENCLIQLGVSITNSELYKQTEELSLIDGLTTLQNKRSFQIKIEHEFHRFMRYEGSLSVIMVDIDHFKKINDTYGHESGDRILSQLGNMLRNFFRSSDIPCRYGGEEFIIILPDTPKLNACNAAERLRKKIEETTFFIDNPPYQIKLTISLGISEFEKTMSHWTDLIEKADKALYLAKNSGRNRTVCA